MVSRGDLIERLWALCERHSPGRVLVLVRQAVTARWVSSLVAERGVAVGVRVYDLETMLRAAATELRGEGLSQSRALVVVRAALLADPEGRYAEIAEHGSYQREVLRAFVDLERGLEGAALATAVAAAAGGAESRDGAMLGAFERFRELMSEERAWWRGQAPQLVLEGHRRVMFLRRRAAAVALGFGAARTSSWEARLIEGLGFERWESGESGESGELGLARRPLDLRLSCAGPEAEIAAVARLLRDEPGRAALVLAPSESVPRWVARLRHRDVPVRAWVERRAANTGAARVLRTLLRILASPGAVRRDELEAVLFGPALRPWSSVAEQLELDYPRCPHPGDLRGAWELQRATSFSLGGLAGRLRAAGDASGEGLSERAQRFGWSAEQLEQRRARARGAHLMLAAAVERLEQLAQAWSPASLHALLDDWDLLGRAAVHGVAAAEMTAARVAVELCARSTEQSSGADGSAAVHGVAELGTELDHALAGASAGSWEQSRALHEGEPETLGDRARAGGEAVWVLPYASVAALGRLPPRVFLTGLDAHPRPPVHHGVVSDQLREGLGLVAERVRFTCELRELDELVASSASGAVVGSWRHRDGAGSRRPPGPWIAGRQDEGEQRAVGVDAIALPTGGDPPCAPLEQRLVDWATDAQLRRRVEAIRSHELPGVGPHTGALGVRVLPSKPYSASALQRYAQQPYQYFVERVIGLRELRRPESAASLLASEQGQVVHRALELSHAARLAASPGGLELASVSEALLAEVLDALADGYRKRAEHGQAEPIWASERDRWAVEIRLWWQRWRERLYEGWPGAPPSSADARRGGSGPRRRPAREQLIPGMLLVATEWSPAADEATSFELDLGLRKIPFVAAIDRIELDPPRQRLIVVDYKTGRPAWASALSAQLRAGLHLQLPLYALAVQQVAAASPERLRLPGPVPVGALRLEYLQRPLPRAGQLARPEARGFSPHDALGVDAQGQVWTVLQAAASFSLAFVAAIEDGRFPLVARGSTRRGFGPSSRIDELARVVPSSDQRASGLPPALEPLPDPRMAREVVQ
ncbi:PD-(D/E)XK nuclease superfamily protein [Enhygromyxa salina]|uniref:PD-(D/E)XK nuclease superfamily protein n=1 Tax=Enhygromyxa salina TaxID=215803 RepID=A0A2S9XBM7_9BACT|nr:PD-(D/E)XK nuclease family protein [Enhygromyxa salina]PRP90264.1 PD-(D/E)XK nuclease superfamily protein [Enhygromyxa salina]